MSARHLAALALACGLFSACRIGWNANSFPVATSPHGTEVELRLADDEVVTAELLALDSTGLLVDDGALLRHVRFDRVQRIEVDGLARFRAQDLMGPSRERLRPFARHPYGLTPEQLDVLLELRGQDVVRSDSAQPPSTSDAGTHASHERGPLDGWDAVDSAALEHFTRIRQAAARYRSVEDAIADGYRRLGPAFPGMGEHWVNPGRVFDGVVDPDAPPVLSFSVIDERRVLTGVAFTRVLAPGEELEGGPLPGHAWHDHASTVDEEALLLVGPSSTHGGASGHRLAMVHVWTHLENPAGPFAQNNWTLPYRQVGLPAPKHVSWKAARALSLRDGGRDFYRMLLVRGLRFEGSDLSRAWAAFERIGEGVDRIVGIHRAEEADTPIDETLEALWDALWIELESSGLSRDALARLDVLRS